MKGLNMTLALTPLFISLGSCSTVSVKTEHANLTGLYDPSFGTDAFIGIPYAQPPVGTLRLQPPLPIDKDQGDLNVTGPASNKCFQIQNSPSLDGSEDCLALDLVRPALDNIGTTRKGDTCRHCGHQSLVVDSTPPQVLPPPGPPTWV